jgi:hypothetical protein
MMATTTRRALLGGAGLAGVVMIAPALAAAANPSALSPGFAKALAEAARAHDAAKHFDQHVLIPAQPRAAAMIDALPHTTVHAGPSLTGGEVIWSTEKPHTVAAARTIVSMAKEGKDMAGAGLKHARQLVAAHLRRTRAKERIHRETGSTAALERSDELGEAYCKAEDVVIGYPITTTADLVAKLAFMVEHRIGEEQGLLNTLHADAVRVAGAGVMA